MPASPPDLAAFEEALNRLKEQGYRIKTYRHFESEGMQSDNEYLAGSDAARAKELNAAFTDQETRVVLAARGGYGVARILDLVDFQLLQKNPKTICGYSDLTALHAAVQVKSKLVSILGPNLMGGWGCGKEESLIERQATIDLLGGMDVGDSLLPSALNSKLKVINGGEATGRLVGGNLAVLNSIIGTPYEPDWNNAILFLEDIGEAPYRIDRMLTQFRMAGVYDRIRGVLLGHFTDCECEKNSSAKLDELFGEFFGNLGKPVLSNFPSGHEHPNLPLPMGALIELDADNQTVRLAEDLFSI